MRAIINKLHFSYRLALGMVVLSVLGFFTMFVIVNTIVRDVIYENVIGIAQRDIIIQAAEIDAWFGASSQTVRSLATALDTLDDVGYFPKIAARFTAEYDFIENVFIGFADGSVINGVGWRPEDAGRELDGVGWGPWEHWVSTERPWFKAAMEAQDGDIAFTDPYVSVSMRTVTVAKSLWVPGLSGTGAAVGFSVSLEYILDRVGEYYVPGGGYALLIGPQGEILVGSGEMTGGMFMEDMLTGGMYISEFDDFLLGPSYLITIPLDAINWTLAAVVPMAATQEASIQYMTVIMVTFSLFVAAILISVVLVVRFLTKDMEERRIVEVAEESNRAKTRFLARMSHEIRTPITAVLGVSEIQLRNPAMSPLIEEAFAKIHNSAYTLLGIVNDILDFSKIEAGKMPLLREEYDTESLISDSSQLYLAFLGDKDVAFEVHVDENLPAYLMGDALRIRQIANNLLSNAFKYTESGKVSFTVSWDNGLVLAIKDTGLGMDADQIEVLYSEYTRFHERGAPYVNGTGLGMSIVYSLANLMGAAISLKSTVGVGTEVAVQIPQDVSRPGTLGKEAAVNLENFKAGTWAAKPDFVPDPMPYGKVLVVDDVEANLYVSRGLLDFYGLDIETCESGYDAIEKVKAGKVYDIIFMDQMMPGINGTEATHILRKLDYYHPVVALTANALIGQAEEFMQAGFDGFISKPIQASHLDAILTKFVRDKQPQSVLDEAAEAATKHGNSPDNFIDRPEVADKLRLDFKRDQRNTIEDMRRALDGGDLNTAHRLAHTTKGLAAMIGEKDLATSAEALEISLKNGEKPPDISGFEDKLSSVLEGIGAGTGHRELYEKLGKLLEDNNSECLEMIEELAKIPETKVLIRQIEDLDFKQALATLRVLKELE